MTYSSMHSLGMVFGVLPEIFTVGLVLLIALLIGAAIMFVKMYQKVEQGTALVRNGLGDTKISFTGMLVIPVLHRSERMDISVKRIEIYRHGESGLICEDNIRADIKVVFFVRVNKTPEDVMRVAQLLGCKRASEEKALVELFDAKFSEALKTVGKQFEFVDLYNSRERFKDEILNIIGTDLNGYVLDDAAIDYLEQTPIEKLNKDNILDAEGIKKITDLTAQQQVLSNNIRREREKTICKQDVEAREAILELERQQAEAEEKQKREISEVAARQQAEAEIVSQQERMRSEQARIATEEEIQVAEENRQRQVIVAQKSKARTEAVESERVEKDRLLEATERERLVTLAQIEKEKAVEVERKNIQDVIRDRVMVERTVVDEEEKIKDVREFAAADRAKQVAITASEQTAEQDLVKEIKAAEAARKAAEQMAQKVVISAEAEREAAVKRTEAKKLLAEGTTAEQAAAGLADAQVLAAVAESKQKEGEVEAHVLELKFKADADGIREKAEAMKLLDEVGREHEEYKLQLEKDTKIELEEINAQKYIAARQAQLMGEALKSAKIDIVGGDNDFFDKIVNSITTGKAVDRMVENSGVLADVKHTFFGANGAEASHFAKRLKKFTGMFGMSYEDIKNLSIAALITRLMSKTTDKSITGELQEILTAATNAGVSDTTVSTLSRLGNGLLTQSK